MGDAATRKQLAAQHLRNGSQNTYRPGKKLKGLLYQMNRNREYERMVFFDRENSKNSLSHEVNIDAPQFMFAA
jgi:hypothetical protein